MDVGPLPSKKEHPQAASVCVAVRCRPISEKENAAGASVAVEIPGSQQLLLRSKGNEQSFTFDHVFGPSAAQEDLFQILGMPRLDQAFDGYNSTIFAYGQTGSGKTHTMLNHLAAEKDRGLIPRVGVSLFTRADELLQQHPSKKFLIWCSFMEVYNEVIYDLLSPNRKDHKSGGLEVKEQKGLGVYVKDLTETVVENSAKMAQLIEEGMSNRATAGTRMNDASSRSHCIFTITIHQKDSSDSSQNTISKLNLVDLAGSERPRDTGAEGSLLKEGANINKSLSALGNVINSLSALAEGKKRAFVPYRDSKLTRVLQESLGGNSFCTMIAAISPSALNCEETISTLNYAKRAKIIKVAATRNEESSQKKVLERELEALQQKIGADTAEGTRAEEVEEKYRQELETLQQHMQQSWEDKQKLSAEYEEQRKVAKEEAERLAAQMVGERKKRMQMLEQHGDVHLTLQTVSSLEKPGTSSEWISKVSGAVKTWEEVQSQLRAVALYGESAGADLSALWSRCGTVPLSEMPASSVTLASTLLGQVEPKLVAMLEELKALTALEAHAKERVGQIAPRVAMAVQQAKKEGAGGGAAGEEAASPSAENEEMKELLQLYSLVEQQLQTQSAREEVKLEADMLRLFSIRGDLERLSKLVEQQCVSSEDLVGKLLEAAEVMPSVPVRPGTPRLAATSVSVSASDAVCLLGLATGEADDAALGASSNSGASKYARLHQNSGFGGWCPRKPAPTEYLEVDLLGERIVVGVSLQGRLPCSGLWSQTADLLRMAFAGAKDDECPFLAIPDRTFARPPVRLLHEVAIALVYSRNCLDWEIHDDFFVYHSMTREQKLEFFDLLIEMTNAAWKSRLSASDSSTGDSSAVGLLVDTSAADMLAGKRCEESNRLLQMLAYLALGQKDKKMGGLGDAGPQWISQCTLEFQSKDGSWHWYKDPLVESADPWDPTPLEACVDATSVKYISLAMPAVATRIRIHPTRWHGAPGLRCELHLAVFDEQSSKQPSISQVAEALGMRSMASWRLQEGVGLVVEAVKKLHKGLEQQQQLHSRNELDQKQQTAQEMGELQRRLQEALAMAESFEARAVAAEAGLLHARADNERLSASVRRWEQDGSKFSEGQSAAEAKVAELEKERSALRASSEDLSEQLMVMKDERDALRAHAERLEEKVAVKDEELKRANRNYVDLTQKLQEQELEEETSNLLADQLAGLNGQVRELQDAHDAAVQECTRLRSESTKLRAENKTLSAERDKLVRKKEKLEVKKAELVDKLNISEKARIAARERCIGLLERQQVMDHNHANADLHSERSGGTHRSGATDNSRPASTKVHRGSVAAATTTTTPSPSAPHFGAGTPPSELSGSLGGIMGGNLETPPMSTSQTPAIGTPTDAGSQGVGHFLPSTSTTTNPPSPAFGSHQKGIDQQVWPSIASDTSAGQDRRRSKRDIRRDSSAPSLRKPQAAAEADLPRAG